MNSDIKFMKIAVKEARKALEENEVPVGAVIVKNNKIISKAHNQKEKLHDASKHAELIAISKASKKLNNWRLNDCTIYVTLEPCVMCASLIRQARIKEIVYALDDKENGAFSSSINLYKHKSNNPTPKVKNNVLDGEAKELLQTFFKTQRKKK